MQFKLLSTANPKAQKGAKYGYLTFVLHLAPADISGHEVCAKRTPGCTESCLNTAGRGGMFKPGENTNTIQKARIRKTQYFFNERDSFMQDLILDINRAIKFANKRNLVPVFRLNATSDLAWEKYTIDGMSIFEMFPEIQFYDYTKILGRKVAHIKNYHLTFSRAECNDADVIRALAMGMNVAQVYDKIPDNLFSADDTDLRFLDPNVGIVALKAKGRAKKDRTGFVIRLQPI